MTARFLAWYLSGLGWIAWLLASLISVAPGGESFIDPLRGGCVAVALAFAALGIYLQCLSSGHWLNRSRAFRVVLMVLAVACSLFVLIGLIG